MDHSVVIMLTRNVSRKEVSVPFGANILMPAPSVRPESLTLLSICVTFHVRPCVPNMLLLTQYLEKVFGGRSLNAQVVYLPRCIAGPIVRYPRQWMAA